MSVRLSLLSILDQGACYGYQLRAEFARRTGSARTLNVGQIYNTLERLERDGLVTRDDPDAQGHVFWHITPAGSREAHAWLTAPAEASGPAELAARFALAATLPGVDVAGALAAQRDATVARLDALRAAAARVDDPAGPAALVAAAEVHAADAALRWIDEAAVRLAAGPRPLPLGTERPRRGRPARPAA